MFFDDVFNLTNCLYFHVLKEKILYFTAIKIMYWALAHYARAQASQEGFRTVKYTKDFKCIFEKLNFV